MDAQTGRTRMHRNETTDPETALRSSGFEILDDVHERAKMAQAFEQSGNPDKTPVFHRALAQQLSITVAYVPSTEDVWIAFRDVDLAPMGFRDITARVNELIQGAMH